MTMADKAHYIQVLLGKKPRGNNVQIGLLPPVICDIPYECIRITRVQAEHGLKMGIARLPAEVQQSVGQ